jgi:uncharacterized membrane protein YccF (DUF307 family)
MIVPILAGLYLATGVVKTQHALINKILGKPTSVPNESLVHVITWPIGLFSKY